MFEDLLVYLIIGACLGFLLGELFRLLQTASFNDPGCYKELEHRFTLFDVNSRRERASCTNCGRSFSDSANFRVVSNVDARNDSEP